MKSKIVLWGSNAQDEKRLIAVSLRAADSKVDIWTFPEEVATEDFYQRMMKEWRDGTGMELPEPHTHIERELTPTEGLLPDDLKVERGDVVQRAHTEWHFVVLSSKLHEAYENQVSALKEKVEQLKEFDQATWDTLKEFWQKVQEQVRERNLFRDHADKLRDNMNVLFGQMKVMRSKMDDEFEKISKEAYDRFLEAFAAVEKKMESGTRIPVLFDELKKMQNKFREANLTREHRNKVWDKLNSTFKAVKEKRFGAKPGGVPGGSGGGNDSESVLQRLQRRYDGLISAIEKMEQSIERDREDLEFQRHKIDTTDGQLEAQIRQAKLLMIEERARSKDEKLNEMIATKVDLGKRLASLKDKENRRMAQEAAKEKIAVEIKAAAEAREDVAEKLGKAAEEIVAAKPAPKAKAKKGDSLVAAIGTTLGESFDDLADTVKAVASVIGDKIEDAIGEFKEDFKEITETQEAAPAAGESAPKEEEPAAPAVEAEIPVEEEVAATEKPDEKE